MKLSAITAVLCLFLTHTALADLEIYKDYDLSESVVLMTTVKVDANMMDVYLEGLKQTWVQANEVSKKLGHIQDYKILQSELPQSGEFNLALLIYFKSGADLEPSKARYQAFMEEWGRRNEDKNKSIAKSYPDVRTISGEYRMREISMMK